MTAFSRGLSDAFMAQLTGGVVAALPGHWRAAGLDVRLRDDYLNVYDQGRSLAKLSHRPQTGLRLVVHHKYVADGRLGTHPGHRQGRHYLRWDVDAALVAAWLDDLPAIRARARSHARQEEQREYRLLRDNPWLLDRQVQVPGTRRQADLVGLAAPDGRPIFVVLEVKAGLNNDIQHAPAQLAEYLDILAPGRGLRADVARSYADVARQLRSLGFAAPDPAPIQPGMPVVGCLVLCDYNRRSRLLGRARDLAATLPHPLYLQLLDDSSDLGQPADWSPLAGA